MHPILKIPRKQRRVPPQTCNASYPRPQIAKAPRRVRKKKSPIKRRSQQLKDGTGCLRTSILHQSSLVHPWRGVLWRRRSPPSGTSPNWSIYRLQRQRRPVTAGAPPCCPETIALLASSDIHGQHLPENTALVGMNKYHEGKPKTQTSPYTHRRGLLTSAHRHFIKGLFPAIPFRTVCLRIPEHRMPRRHQGNNGICILSSTSAPCTSCWKSKAK